MLSQVSRSNIQYGIIYFGRVTFFLSLEEFSRFASLRRMGRLAWQKIQPLRFKHHEIWRTPCNGATSSLWKEYIYIQGDLKISRYDFPDTSDKEKFTNFRAILWISKRILLRWKIMITSTIVLSDTETRFLYSIRYFLLCFIRYIL